MIPGPVGKNLAFLGAGKKERNNSGYEAGVRTRLLGTEGFVWFGRLLFRRTLYMSTY